MQLGLNGVDELADGGGQRFRGQRMATKKLDDGVLARRRAGLGWK
jgi:hypothetical protein